ncbi:MAG TPA: hypothetical protein VKY74_27850 [Chloroflexia bacterium]|nr:hypothetical protein [Chloroflexia bacterium]
MKRPAIFGVLILAAAWPSLAGTAPATRAQSDCRTFSETGHPVCGRFLQYWEQHGGLAQQGYPLSEPLPEVSDTDGQLYTVQYFERAVFEYHSEYAGTPYAVLLSLLGTTAHAQRYCCAPAPPQTPNLTNPRFFPETGKTLGGRFRAYWESHGGLAQQGYPLTDEFPEQSRLNGQTYTVQYFERAVFEWHPENAPPFDVLLTQLGTLRYDRVRACFHLTERRGQILAQGTDPAPTTFPPLQGYRVEQVMLPGITTCSLDFPDPSTNTLYQQTRTFDHYWIVTVSGGPFHIGEPLWYLWFDQSVLGAGAQKRAGELSTVIVDRQYLREGARIRVSRGFDKDLTVVFSQPVHFTTPPQGD